MTIELEGQRDPERVSAAEGQKKISAMRQKHKGKRVSQMTKPDQDELLEAIAIFLKFADENGVVG